MASRFGISTHLFHADRLRHDHLAAVARAGFDTVELYATRTHFDYHEPAAATELAGWLDDTRLTLNSVHAPICASLTNGAWGETFSNAVQDEPRRKKALDEAQAALAIASRLPYRYLVVHLGVPDSAAARGTLAGGNPRARRLRLARG